MEYKKDCKNFIEHYKDIDNPGIPGCNRDSRVFVYTLLISCPVNCRDYEKQEQK